MKHEDYRRLAADINEDVDPLDFGDDRQLILHFEGKIVPKERPRTGKNGHVFTPTRTRKCEAEIAATVPTTWKPFLCPVQVIVIISEVPPKWAAKYPEELLNVMSPKKGDLDNKVKTITDALNGLAYRDDDQIARILAWRRYSTVNEASIKVSRYGVSDHEARQIAKFL